MTSLTEVNDDDDTVTRPTVTLYTKEHCQQCGASKRKLEKEGIVYSTVDCSAAYLTPKELLASMATPEEIAEAQRNVEAIRELGHLQMPVMVVSNPEPGAEDFHWSGFRPDLIMKHC